jgi:hypothetical protein
MADSASISWRHRLHLVAPMFRWDPVAAHCRGESREKSESFLIRLLRKQAFPKTGPGHTYAESCEHDRALAGSTFTGTKTKIALLPALTTE